MVAVTIDEFKEKEDDIAYHATTDVTNFSGTDPAAPAENNLLIVTGQCGSGDQYGFDWVLMNASSDGYGPENSDGYTLVDEVDPGGNAMQSWLGWKNAGASESADPTFYNGGWAKNADEFGGCYAEISGFAGTTATKAFNSENNGNSTAPAFNNITGLDNAKTYSVICFVFVDGNKTITLPATYTDTDMTNGTFTPTHTATSTRWGKKTGVSPSGGAISIADASFSGATYWVTGAVAIEEAGAGGTHPVGPMGHPLMGPLGGPV